MDLVFFFLNQIFLVNRTIAVRHRFFVGAFRSDMAGDAPSPFDMSLRERMVVGPEGTDLQRPKPMQKGQAGCPGCPLGNTNARITWR
jgi:hypothetical protein